jgi:hypothetical protein
VFYRVEPQAPKLCTGRRRLDLTARRSLRRRRSRRASADNPPHRGAAADIAELYYGPCRVPALAGRSELVSGCPGRLNDRARHAALHGGAHEGEDKAHVVDHTPRVTTQNSRVDIIRDAMRSVTGNSSLSSRLSREER